MRNSANNDSPTTNPRSSSMRLSATKLLATISLSSMATVDVVSAMEMKVSLAASVELVCVVISCPIDDDDARCIRVGDYVMHYHWGSTVRAAKLP